jgi:hypothetical protein
MRGPHAIVNDDEAAARGETGAVGLRATAARVDREHGRAFDALVRQARDRLYGAPDAAMPASMGTELAMAAKRPL